MNITYCIYSLYVSLTWHFHHTAVASVAVYCRDAGPGVHEVSHLRNCSSTTLLYIALHVPTPKFVTISIS